jgi:hypothetical protein
VTSLSVSSSNEDRHFRENFFPAGDRDLDFPILQTNYPRDDFIYHAPELWRVLNGISLNFIMERMGVKITFKRNYHYPTFTDYHTNGILQFICAMLQLHFFVYGKKCKLKLSLCTISSRRIGEVEV